jgi:hypothetical protein
MKFKGIKKKTMKKKTMKKKTMKKKTMKKKTMKKKTMKKKVKNMKGGETTFQGLYDGPGNSNFRLFTEDDIEKIFNPNPTAMWKEIKTLYTRGIHTYTYPVYNTTITPKLIYFSNLPKQIAGSEYVPIYSYDAAPLAVPFAATRSGMFPPPTPGPSFPSTSHTGMPTGTRMLTAIVPSSRDYEISKELLDIYNYIVNTAFKESWEVCLRNVSFCPFQPATLDRAHRTCCGFIAPAFGAMLHYFDKVQGGITDKVKEKAIQFGLNFYATFGAYSPTSPHKIMCQNWSKILKPGVNILTLYGRNTTTITDCSTYHHFIVFVRDEFSIIIDSWSGGISGHRGEWARIMRTQDVYAILNEISITPSLEITDALLNEYFIVPHSIRTQDNIDRSKQTELLDVGAYNLIDWDQTLDQLARIPSGNYVPYGGKKI